MVPAAFHYCSCESVGQSLFVFLFCSYWAVKRTERAFKSANELGEPPNPGSRIQGPGSKDPKAQVSGYEGFVPQLSCFVPTGQHKGQRRDPTKMQTNLESLQIRDLGSRAPGSRNQGPGTADVEGLFLSFHE
jgi:hypothetical protein